MILSTLAVIASMALLLLLIFLIAVVIVQAPIYGHQQTCGNNEEAMEYFPHSYGDDKLNTFSPAIQLGNVALYRRTIGGCNVL